jgi:hypothetical protein
MVREYRLPLADLFGHFTRTIVRQRRRSLESGGRAQDFSSVGMSRDWRLLGGPAVYRKCFVSAPPSGIGHAFDYLWLTEAGNEPLL